MGKPQGSATKPCTREDIEAVLMNRELFLYDYDNDSAMHCLNSGAAVVWFLCDGTRDTETIAAHIAATYSLPVQQVLTEVRETLAHFQALGLLESQYLLKK